MATIEISADELKDAGLPYCGNRRLGVEILRDEITDTSRWSIHHEIIFRWTDGKTYRADYSVGATESQDEAPWEYEDYVECEEVAQVERVVKVWEAV